MSVATSEAEREYLDRIKDYPDDVITAHEDSVQEGFTYFEAQKSTLGLIKDKFLSVGLSRLPTMMSIFREYMQPMMQGRNRCFEDLEPYLDRLEESGRLTPPEDSPLVKSYPNEDIWEDLTAYAWQEWQVKLGFTELPRQLIFKDKAVLFKYALVCIQEMDREKLEKAPDLEAGAEVPRVYSELGFAVNDIARWLREAYGIACQSNHPLGGLVNSPPLAGKAGLGWQGHNGLLITPEYGQRQRIAPIFVEGKLFRFTDSREHMWIEDFCKTCRACEKACPTYAIYSEKQTGIEDVPGIGETRTCIDRLKCWPEFSRTLGCSICIKVCPFSRGEDVYEKLRERFENSQRESTKTS
jgi:ferredoxin